MASPKMKPQGPFLWVHLRLTRMQPDPVRGVIDVSLQGRACLAFSGRETSGLYIGGQKPKGPHR